MLDLLPLLLVIKKPVYNLCSLQITAAQTAHRSFEHHAINGLKNKLKKNEIQ